MTSTTSEGVYIFTATGRKKTYNGGHRTIKKGASTDPKKHFEVVNFIPGHFVNFLEEIYQEKILDVSSPLKNTLWHVNEQVFLYFYTLKDKNADGFILFI